MIDVRRTGSWDLAGLDRDLTAANRAVGRDLAKILRRELTAARKASGVPARFRNMGNVTLGFKCRTFAGPNRVTVDVTPSAPGPWSIVEYGTKGHAIRAKNADALSTPQGPLDAVDVSGVPARRGWTRTVERGDEPIGDAVAELYDDALGG